MSPSTSKEALCCCEYENEGGERTHILGCFCDCEALDQVFDRCLTCRPVPHSLSSRMWKTIADRCRVPGLPGRGAVKLDPEVVVPVLIVPITIFFAALNWYFTGIALLALPIVMLLFYRSWKRQQQRVRTKMFFVWAVTSVLVTFAIYLYSIIATREVLLWENMLLFNSILAMFICLYHVKTKTAIMGPGNKQANLVPNTMPEPSSSNGKAYDNYINIDEYTKVVTNSGMGNFLTKNMGFEKDSFKQNFEAQTAPTLDESQVTWVDSRPIENGQLVTWCEKCCIVKPARSGHCNVCSACIRNRDHHCVWIDACVGAHNHRHFLLALVLFIFAGFYGAHLTFTTVCTPVMYLDYFLIPNDCKFVYTDFTSALCFVSACYAALGAGMMCMGLVVQLILISQNATSQELHQAAMRGKTVMGVFIKSNIHNKGFLRNWFDFLCRVRGSSPNIPI